MAVIDLIGKELLLVGGAGRYYCGDCNDCECLYIGQVESEEQCRRDCYSKGQKGWKLLPDCNHTCLGMCFTKCSLSSLEILNQISGLGADKWVDVCKEECYQPCGCALTA